MDRLVFRKRIAKRRLQSPSYFPRKVFLSEEKVLNDLGQLSLNDTKRCMNNSTQQKPYYLTQNEKGQRSFQDIEDSLCIEDYEIEESPIEILPEIARDLKIEKRKILLQDFRRPVIQIPKSHCTEIVLWKPPDTMSNIMKILNNQQAGENLPCRRRRARKYAVADVNISVPSDELETEALDTSDPFALAPEAEIDSCFDKKELEEMEF